MVEIVAYRPEHLFMIDVQEAQMEQISKYMTMEAATALLDGTACSAMDGDVCMASAGVIDAGGGRGLAWAILGKYSGRHFVQIVRGLQRFMDVSPYRRLEMACAADFPAAHRLALLLGFLPEGRMNQYFSETKDAILYAKVKHG